MQPGAVAHLHLCALSSHCLLCSGSEAIWLGQLCMHIFTKAHMHAGNKTCMVWKCCKRGLAGCVAKDGHVSLLSSKMSNEISSIGISGHGSWDSTALLYSEKT